MTTDARAALHGLPIIESVYAVKDGEPIIHRRRWRHRLLSWPWRPWVATQIEIPKVPTAYQMGAVLVAHPAVVAELKRLSTMVAGMRGHGND